MHRDEVPIDEDTLRRLLAAQFPDLADEPLRIVLPWGTDNAIWRVGADLVARLPRIAWASGQPAKEAAWLPVLATHLPTRVPEPVSVGRPSEDYPFEWALHRWLPGVGASPETIGDPEQFALDLIEVIEALKQAPVEGAPEATNRARPLAAYDEATRQAIKQAAGLIDADAALAVWEAGLAAPPFEGSPRWVHGDLEGNCLVEGGRLSAVIDWNSACVGDPAVDVQVAWSPLFTEDSRELFLDRLGVDEHTIARAKAAAINQACAALPYYLDTYPLIVERSWHKLAGIGVAAV